MWFFTTYFWINPPKSLIYSKKKRKIITEIPLSLKCGAKIWIIFDITNVLAFFLQKNSYLLFS